MDIRGVDENLGTAALVTKKNFRPIEDGQSMANKQDEKGVALTN